MVRSLAAAAFAVVLLVPMRGQSQAGPVKACIQSWPEARYRALGYNHIVHVQNRCDARAECAVSTNVNPQPEQVVVPGHQEVEVTTFLGSPAREFTPKVECRMVR
jgi:hypothetical protein